MKNLKNIPGYQLYRITKDGTVYSYRLAKRRKLSSFKQMYGYLIVHLRSDSHPKTRLLHQLVMSAWGTEKPSEEHIISFIDHNKENTHIDNLEWKLKKDVLGNRRKPVVAVSEHGNRINFKSITEASIHFKTNHPHICNKINRKEVYKGYRFYRI